MSSTYRIFVIFVWLVAATSISGLYGANLKAGVLVMAVLGVAVALVVTLRPWRD